MPGVHVPADVELADRLAFGLTGRQLLILGASALLAYGSESLIVLVAPLPVALAGALLTAACGVGLSLASHDGLRGEELLLGLARFAFSPRTLLLAPEGLPLPLPGERPLRAAALEPPVARILASGLVELADASHCLILRASGTSFALREAEEQAAFVTAFGSFLNGLGAPIQIQVSREAASLEPLARALEQGAERLGPGIAAAARDHARFLRGLGSGEAPLQRRRILLVLRSAQQRGELAEAALARSARQASELLGGAGVSLQPLTGAEASALLARVLAPPGAPGEARLEGVIRARARRD